MPSFEYHIFVCGNQRYSGHPRGCCDPEGGEALRNAFKLALKAKGLRATARANRSGCLDQCEHGPCVVVYPEAIWYGAVGLEDVEEIVQSHIIEGAPVERLLLLESCINNRDCPHRRKG